MAATLSSTANDTRSAARSVTAQVLSGTGQQSLARVLSSLCSFAALLMVSRLPDKREFGIYSYYLTAFAMAGTFINFGANGIAVREMSRFPERVGWLLGAVIKFKLKAGVLGFLAMLALALTHEADAWSTVLVSIAALHLVPLAYSSAVTALHAELKFLVPSVALVAGMGAFVAGSFVAYELGAGRAGVYLILYAMGQLVQAGILFVVVRRRVVITYGQAWRELKPLVREMAPIGISAVAATTYYFINTILLRDLRGDVEVGLFNAAYRLITLAIMVPTCFTQALFPVLSREAHGDPRRFGLMLQQSVLFLTLIGAPITAALQLLAPRVIDTLYQPAFAPSAQLLKWLSWAMLCIFASSPLVTALTAQGRQAVFTRVAVGAGAFNVALNLILIPRLGLVGAAVTTVATEGLVLGACLVALVRCSLVPVIGRELWLKVPVVCGVVLAAAALVQSWPLWLAIATLGAVQIVVLYALRCLPPDLTRAP
ncbi:MAG: flippase [Planctomycetota bacterium]